MFSCYGECYNTTVKSKSSYLEVIIQNCVLETAKITGFQIKSHKSHPNPNLKIATST